MAKDISVLVPMEVTSVSELLAVTFHIHKQVFICIFTIYGI